MGQGGSSGGWQVVKSKGAASAEPWEVRMQHRTQPGGDWQ